MDADGPILWFCKRCGWRTYRVSTHEAACPDCGGLEFFRNCNTVFVGSAKVKHRNAVRDWHEGWRKQMDARAQ